MAFIKSHQSRQKARYGPLTRDWLLPPPRGEVDRREPVGWGAVFDAGILTPPAALFERDSLPIKGRDKAMLDRFAARRREGVSKSDLPITRTCGAPSGRVRCANRAATRRPAYAAIF